MFCYFRDFAFKQLTLQVECFVLVDWLICVFDLCVDLFGEIVERGGTVVYLLFHYSSFSDVVFC